MYVPYGGAQHAFESRHGGRTIRRRKRKRMLVRRNTVAFDEIKDVGAVPGNETEELVASVRHAPANRVFLVLAPYSTDEVER